MIAGKFEPYINQRTYCELKILYDECRWWELLRKKRIKELIDWIYPFMRIEIKSLSDLNNKLNK